LKTQSISILKTKKRR